MKEFFLKHKVTLITISVILAVILSGVYLYATLYPGLWLNDAFLYQQKDGSFRGSDQWGQYMLVLQHDGSNATATMTVNDVTHIYEILQNDTALQILQDGESIFDGTVVQYGDVTSLKSNDGSYSGIVVQAGNANYTTEELFPSPEWLYRCAHLKELSTRGQPWMLALAWFCVAWIIVDICFPNLFFRLRYMWNVDGGAPSDIYRMRQSIGRVVVLFLIIVILIMGFNHT